MDGTSGQGQAVASGAPAGAPADGEARMAESARPRRRGYGPTAPVAVVILTLNEEINIGECLASCAWCDDVHVVDSGSTDATVEIARRMGAQVHVHPFESFGAQRNWAIDNVPAAHDWIFHLDADERFTTELVEEMARVLATDPAEAGFHVPHKLIFMGRWLKRAGGYPTYQMRLFHRRRMRFRDYGHGQREDSEGKVGLLTQPYTHHIFRRGIHHWLDNHNRYSSLEALQVGGERGRCCSTGCRSTRSCAGSTRCSSWAGFWRGIAGGRTRGCWRCTSR
jgi:hypothetical protein